MLTSKKLAAGNGGQPCYLLFCPYSHLSLVFSIEFEPSRSRSMAKIRRYPFAAILLKRP
jgi:hypothetical protein